MNRVNSRQSVMTVPMPIPVATRDGRVTTYTVPVPVPQGQGRPAIDQEAVDELRYVLKCYERKGHLSPYQDNGRLVLGATGKLDAATVRKLLERRGVDRDRFSKDLFNAVRLQLHERVKERIGQAKGSIETLRRDPSGLIDVLSRMKTREQRVKSLRALGIDADTARRIARAPKRAATELRQALGKVGNQLDRALRSVGVQALDDRHGEAMFRLFKPVLNQMRSQLGIRSGSCADQAIKRGLARCKTARRIDQALTVAASIVAAGAGGAITAGFGVAGSVAFGAGSAAFTGAPGVVAAKARLEAVRGAAASGVAREGAVEEARKGYQAAKINYGKGIVLGAAAGGTGSVVGRSKGITIKGAESVVNGGAGALGEEVSRGSDPIVAHSVNK